MTFPKKSEIIGNPCITCKNNYIQLTYTKYY